MELRMAAGVYYLNSDMNLRPLSIHEILQTVSAMSEICYRDRWLKQCVLCMCNISICG